MIHKTGKKRKKREKTDKIKKIKKNKFINLNFKFLENGFGNGKTLMIQNWTMKDRKWNQKKIFPVT